MPAQPPSPSLVDDIIAKTLARVDADPRFSARQRTALRALAAESRLTNADDIVRALEGDPGDADAPR